MSADELEQMEQGVREFKAFRARLTRLFACSEPREKSRQYLRGLLAPVARKNCWHIAEAVGESDSSGRLPCFTTGGSPTLGTELGAEGAGASPVAGAPGEFTREAMMPHTKLWRAMAEGRLVLETAQQSKTQSPSVGLW